MTRWLVPVVFAVVFMFSGVQATPAHESPALSTAVVEELMFNLNRYHLESPGLDELEDGAVKGMLKELKDPYTQYIPPEKASEFKDLLDSGMNGIGVELQSGSEYSTGYPMVVKVLEYSPAQKAGIKAGDLIISVNGMDLNGFSLARVVDLITGPEGSSLELTVRRDDDTKKYNVTREHINVPTVQYTLLDDSTGYLEISSFGANTGAEFKRGLDYLLENGMEYLVLDLRNNGGGYMDAAVEIASEFLPAGKLIAAAVDNRGEKGEYISPDSGGDRKIDLPAAVVVNRYTASAAEVLAGALQHYGAAEVVGTRTFGKGSLQSIVPLETGGFLKVTTHRYTLPSGEDIEGKGIVPDREINIPELQAAMAGMEIKKDRAEVIEYNLNKGIIRVDGLEIDYPHTAFEKEGKVFAPLRFTLEAFGYTIENRDDAVIAVNGEESIVIDKINSPLVVREGVSFMALETLKVPGLELKKESGRVTVVINIL